MSRSCIPSQLHNITVCLVPKTAGATELDKMRPISLEEVLIKLITSIYNSEIGKLWSRSKIQTGLQYAGPGSSVADPIFITKSIYHEALNETSTPEKPRRHLHVLYIDLRKAFDKAPHHFINAAMRSLGVPEFMLDFFNVMDTNSRLRFKTSKTNLTPGIKPSCGTLQGDPASGTRFNSIMFLLMFRLRAAKVGWLTATGDLIYGHCYADDTVLFAESHADLQHLADIVSEFCESLNIGINADKTIYVTTDTTAPDIEIYKWRCADRHQSGWNAIFVRIRDDR